MNPESPADFVGMRMFMRHRADVAGLLSSRYQRRLAAPTRRATRDVASHHQLETRMDDKIVFAAAQLPFEAGPNLFCTLAPVCTVAGDPIDAIKALPPRGLCWFWLRELAFTNLTPGQLVVGKLEQSREHGKPAGDKDWWQLAQDSAALAGAPSTTVEIIQAAARDGSDPRTLLDRSRRFSLDHKPASIVMVELDGMVYGPFKPALTRGQQSSDGAWSFPVERTGQPPTWCANRAMLEQAGAYLRPKPVKVSTGEDTPARSASTRIMAYRLMPWDQFQNLEALGAQEIDLQTTAEVLGRVARDHLKPRARAQAFKATLEELSASLRSLPEAEAERITAAQVQQEIDASIGLADQLADALLGSGRMDEDVRAAAEDRFKQHLEMRATEAQAEINAAVQQGKQDLARIIGELEYYKESINQERQEARDALKAELDAARRTFDATIDGERRSLEKQQEALERERVTIAQTIENAAERFTTGRQDLVSDLLALMPALEATGLMRGAGQSPSEVAGLRPSEAAKPRPQAPAPFVTRAEKAPLGEEEFLKRLAGHAEASGLHYREHDLQAFHLAVKCTDITVAGGMPGVGKSSLARIYAEALAGDDAGGPRRLLTVDVSPSWTEPQDIMGMVNLLDRRYEQAPAGLFAHLASAQQEHAAAGDNAGMAIIILDEMNLAQPEHYLAGFIQALERQQPRLLPVFDPSALQPDDPLQQFSTLKLPPTLRFIGTVNFDETTRPLSARLKDRAAIIDLTRARHTAAQPRTAAAAGGQPARLADFKRWRTPEAAPVEVAKMMDALDEPLSAMGCPITPRRGAALEMMVGASRAVCSPEQALDIAIMTRVLPSIRGLDRTPVRQAAKRLAEAMSAGGTKLKESRRTLVALVAQAEADWGGLGDED